MAKKRNTVKNYYGYDCDIEVYTFTGCRHYVEIRNMETSELIEKRQFPNGEDAIHYGNRRFNELETEEVTPC